MDTKKLRQKILDLAIHGKLVPQDPNDEPASVLLERIKAEKERLIKEGKIKGSKKYAKTSDTPHYGNMPFEVPDNWKWCKLEDIVSFGGGKTPSMDNKEYWHNGNHLWVTSKDMKYSHITDSLMKITDKALELMTIYERGTLLIVTRSGILRHTLPISILESPATVNQDLKAISPYLQELSEYLYIVIKANEHFILKEYHKDGTTVDSIDFDKFKCLPIPLPPITEQRRIVAETKHWFALIEQINQDKSDLHTIIHKVKNKILDFAIHGKLVPQDPNDEPAFELLKRINPKAEITCDNGHSEKLPQGWYSATINDVCSIIGGVSYNKADIQDTGIRVLRGGNIQSGKVFYCSDDVFIPFSYQNKENQVQYGDIIVVASTGSQTLIGKTGFVDRDIPKTQIGAFLRIVRPKQKTLSPYIRLLFQTDAYKDYIRNVAKGSNINNVKNAHLQNYQICLPPLVEQQRIVAKIEELFSVLDNIQNALEA
ncbi:restriction endonuclease subunit S [Bacteroides uniformis]|uniref:restriction endonuclease subunit S n=1 Tax=Bacteroides uniformis TaxID=820 RepID=UPI0039B583EC